MVTSEYIAAVSTALWNDLEDGVKSYSTVKEKLYACHLTGTCFWTEHIGLHVDKGMLQRSRMKSTSVHNPHFLPPAINVHWGKKKWVNRKEEFTINSQRFSETAHSQHLCLSCRYEKFMVKGSSLGQSYIQEGGKRKMTRHSHVWLYWLKITWTATPEEACNLFSVLAAHFMSSSIFPYDTQWEIALCGV